MSVADSPVPLVGTHDPSAPTPPLAPPPPSRRTDGGRRRALNALGVVALASIIAASSLYLLGLPPFQSLGGGPPHGAVTFSEARAAGDTYMHSVPGGAWRLLAAGAVLIQADLSYPSAAATSTFLNCTVRSMLPGPTGSVPAYHGDPRAGTSPIWGLIYWGNGSGRVLSVVNGTPSVTASISGGASCRALVSLAQPVPSTIADSPAVSQAASAAGGAAFLSGHPSANVTWTLDPGGSAYGFGIPPQWQVAYSLCSLTAAHPPPASQFRANVSATGSITSTHQGVANCSASSAPFGITLGERLAPSVLASGPSITSFEIARADRT